ncbi:unnamed protein product [Schistosoma margrebowiei]|uniref:Uncharacterized protein n=1 Tax=Schistosoma margrebowiei TaxID=48269 RepID=A0A183LWI0_9TREM|nr:unnamed protein product [Schistosoma margrebowiei]
MLYLCPVCPHSCASQSGLIGHLTLKHKERLAAVCKVCQQIFASDAIGSHVLTCKGSYSCPYCRATFSSPSYLQRHISRRHEIFDRPTCSVCGKGFSSTNSLAVHKRFLLTCCYCSRVYASRAYLLQHIKKHEEKLQIYPIPSLGTTSISEIETSILDDCRVNVPNEMDKVSGIYVLACSFSGM